MLLAEAVVCTFSSDVLRLLCRLPWYAIPLSAVEQLADQTQLVHKITQPGSILCALT